MVAAFAAEAALGALTLTLFGTGEHGTLAALAITARFSFVLFWGAYAGAGLVTVFGKRFLPLKREGRRLGLAFASAHLAHVGLVAWLCAIGAAPGTGVFLFFGIALVFIYALALASLPVIRRALGEQGWWWLRVAGMNFIAYAFARDFLRISPFTSLKTFVLYLPFDILSLGGPCFYVAAARASSTRK